MIVTCEKIIPLISGNNKVLKICLDKSLKKNKEAWSIYKNNILKIKYVPFIVNIDKDCSIIREIALVQFLTIIKSKNQ